MRPPSLSSRIFLDSGNPEETASIKTLLGFLDGQTTNPSLVAKHPDIVAQRAAGKAFTREALQVRYRDIVRTIAGIIPHGSVSIEVYADAKTTADELFAQGREMFSWIPNAHVKYPTTKEGLAAAERSIAASMRVNMTLCFTQQQAAAVYAATRGAKRGDVFVSPFVGRLDDRGVNGMALIAHILTMYRTGDGHVEVLTASVRSLAHLLEALRMRSDIITAPFSVLKEWGEKGMPMPAHDFVYPVGKLAPIVYEALDLTAPWNTFNLAHPLTAQGLERFASDWNALTTH